MKASIVKNTSKDSFFFRQSMKVSSVKGNKKGRSLPLPAVLFSLFVLSYCLNLLVVFKHHVDQDATTIKIEKDTRPAAVGRVPPRIRQMNMYKERYNYRPPEERHDNHTEINEICGIRPNYEKFFSYNFRSRSETDEDKIIYELFFKNDTIMKGSVVEMGAYTGLQASNSRFFDLCLGWETLLVEAMPKSFEQILTNRPNAHNFNFVPSCTEADEVANKTVQFDNYAQTNAGVQDGSVTTAYSVKNWTVDVPCGSLTKVLLDIFPNGHVSFFSLDVEGSEPSVVGALDFKKVFIEVMMIETSNNFCKRFQYCESRNQFRKIMRDEGYVLFEKVVPRSDLFIHPQSIRHLQAMKERGHVKSDWGKAVVEKQ